MKSGSDVGQLGMNSSGLQLRTRSAKDILFTTNNTERARIDSSGRLGLGTSSPAHLLDINTTDNTTYTAGNLINNATARIHNSSTTTNSFASLAFRTGSGDNAIGFKYTGTANQADFVIVNDGAANGNEVFRIDSSGNIKINGDSPYLYLSDNDNNWIRGSSSINAILFGTNNSESMRIDSSGQVGIGTTSPSTTLHLKVVLQMLI